MLADAYKLTILGEGKHEHLYRLEGDTWEDVMRQHHEKQGWEPYKPMDSHKRRV